MRGSKHIPAAPLLFWLECAKKAREEGHQIFTMTALGRAITFPLTGEMVKVSTMTLVDIPPILLFDLGTSQRLRIFSTY